MLQKRGFCPGVYVRQSWNLAFSAMCDSVGFIRPCHWTVDWGSYVRGGYVRSPEKAPWPWYFCVRATADNPVDTPLWVLQRLQSWLPVFSLGLGRTTVQWRTETEVSVLMTTGECEHERASEASETVWDAQHRPTATCRRVEQWAAGGAQRRAANTNRTSETARLSRRTAGTQRRAHKRQQTTFGQVYLFAVKLDLPGSPKSGTPDLFCLITLVKDVYAPCISCCNSERIVKIGVLLQKLSNKISQGCHFLDHPV